MTISHDVFEAAFERFAIMTMDGYQSDDDALRYITMTYGGDVAAEIRRRFCNVNGEGEWMR